MASGSARDFANANGHEYDDKEIMLFDAVTNNNLQLTDKLLCEGTNPNTTNGRGRTPLMIAVQNSNEELVQCLLKHNADVNAIWTQCSGTALMIAGASNSVVTFDLLLKAGADVNIQDILGDTILMQVIYNNYQGLANTLLQTGKCQLDICNNSGQTAMHLAVDLDNITMVQILLAAGANPEVGGQNGQTPLMCAQSKEVAEVLLAAGCDPNYTDTDGMPCLHYAIKKQVPEVASQLIQAGANVNVVYEDGKTPLFWALICWLSSTVEELISYGAVVTARDHKNRGAIYFAATLPDPFTCQYLITKGADPNVTASDGTTPIYIAVARHNSAVAKVLLEHNVHIDRLYPYDGKMVTLLDIAIAEHLEEVSSLLYELGCAVTEHYPLSKPWPPGVLSVLTRIRKPRRLLASCRIVLRSYFGGRLLDYLESMPIPKAVKDYVLMKDLFPL